MGFWNNVMSIMDDGDETGADKADKVIYNLHQIEEMGIKETKSEYNLKAKKEMNESKRQLPIGKVHESDGNCQTCGTYAEGLGNGLCVKCWDFVVDYSNAHIMLWPDTIQYEEIYNRLYAN